MMITRVDPTAEEVAALEAYAQKVGKGWRVQLAADWARAGSVQVDSATYSILHGVRNRFGPDWLEHYGR